MLVQAVRATTAGVVYVRHVHLTHVTGATQLPQLTCCFGSGAVPADALHKLPRPDLFLSGMSLSQALRLARIELAGLSGTSRLQRLSQIVRLFASEIAGTVALAPFGLKAQQLYTRLPAPPASKGSQTEDEDVYVVKRIYYGSRPRNTVDLYLPGEACQDQQQRQHPQLPVVLFVHGGGSSQSNQLQSRICDLLQRGSRKITDEWSTTSHWTVIAQCQHFQPDVQLQLPRVPWDDALDTLLGP